MKTYAEWAKAQPVNELSGFLSNLFNTGMGRPPQPQQQQQITLPVARRIPTAQPVDPNQPPAGTTLARRAQPQTAQPAGAPQPAPGTTLAGRPQPQPAAAPVTAPVAQAAPAQPTPAPQAAPTQPQAPQQPVKDINPKNPFGATPFQKPPTPADGSAWADWLKRNNLPTDYQPGQPTNMRDRAKQGLSYQANKGMDKGYLDSVARKYQKPQQQAPQPGGASFLYQPGA
jgi:pyruvate/2-oxoglutarate dehydrogenase complex dihydrolipoamide acyltransferase (E2) component